MVQGVYVMNEDTLAQFLLVTFMPFVPIVGGFVVAITTLIVLFIMHSWIPIVPQEKK